MIAVAVIAIYYGGFAAALLVGFLGCLSIIEWVGLFKPMRDKSVQQYSMIAVIAVILVGFYVQPAAGVMLLAILTAVLFFYVHRRDPTLAGWVALGLPYIGCGCLALLALREWPGNGLGLTIFLVLAVWGTDIGAYFTGRKLRGPKLCPKISPSKTWSGLIGGMVMATLLVLAAAGLEPVRQPWIALVLAPIVAVVSQAGDMFESYVKRRCGAKDSGTLIPGHGGVLDRIDGLVFAAMFLVVFQLILGDGLQWW